MVRADGTAPPVSVWKSVSYHHSAGEDAEPRSRTAVIQSGEQAESSKKKVPRKKQVNTGVWPCKINGCDKQFAREADLKRHQRTTKLHSMPGFQCPQCDANFTRTDALRRHQKSRHDGVVIEPGEVGKGDGEEEGRSRSGTPSTSSKGKEKATTLPVQTHQGAPTHTGPSSYYRSHTAVTTPHVPSLKTVLPLPPPTGPPWTNYPSSWQNADLPPNMGPIGYLPQPVYYPSPHYRPHTTGYSTATTSRNSSTQPPHSSSTTSDPIIDPNLNEQSEITEADVVAAVQAVLRQAESEAEAKKQRELEMRNCELGLDNSDNDQIYSSSLLERPEPMEHILTEDGEPMLNPAELLTSESLASPPPS